MSFLSSLDPTSPICLGVIALIALEVFVGLLRIVLGIFLIGHLFLIRLRLFCQWQTEHSLPNERYSSFSTVRRFVSAMDTVV